MRIERQVTKSRGFSLVEMLVSLAITMAIGGMAALRMGDVLSQMRADNAAAKVITTFREAHERAVTERRNYQIQFSGNNQIQLLRLNVPTGSTVIATRLLDYGAQFQLYTGLPDTPEAFGNSSATSFGSSSSLTFLSDGTFIDSTGAPLNGTVFFGKPNVPMSARAVTIMGATGKIQLYRWNGTQWAH
jgi:Tfp pilus assembly protein FimT